MARIVLKNVRLSFPHIWKKARFEGEETKFEATLLIDKESQAEQIEAIEKAIEDALLEKFGEAKKIPKAIRASSKTCFRDGDESDYDGYENHMSFKGANDMQPSLLQINKQPATEDMNLFYAGCYVDAIVEVWIQNNAYGKRINANLFALRYRGEGEPFSSGRVPKGVEDDFEDIDTDEEDALDPDDI